MTTLEKLEQRIQKLEDIHAITQLKHRYFRLLDHQDWDGLRECFTEDVQTHYESGHYHFEGIEEVMRFLSESLEGLRGSGRWGIHLGHHPEIELLSETKAHGRWTLHAAVLDRGAGRAGRQESFYQDEYRKTDGVWRICRTGYETFAQGSWAAPDLEMQVGDEADSRQQNAEAREASS
jgi:hypothetical protein